MRKETKIRKRDTYYCEICEIGYIRDHLAIRCEELCKKRLECQHEFRWTIGDLELYNDCVKCGYFKELFQLYEIQGNQEILSKIADILRERYNANP